MVVLRVAFNEEEFGERYNKGLPGVNRRWQTIVQGLTNQIIADEIPLEDRPELVRANEAAIKASVRDSYQALYNQSTKGAYASAIREVAKESTEVGIAFFLKDSIPVLTSTVQNQRAIWGLEIANAAQSVFDTVQRWATTSGEVTISPFFFDSDLLRTSRLGRLTIETQVNSFFRAATVENGNLAGVQRYKYAGPRSGTAKTPDAPRPFCRSLLGRVFTVEEIQQMNNGQTSNVFTTGGGFKCRHRWVPIAPTVADENRTPLTQDEIDKRLAKLPLPPNKDVVFVKSGNNTIGQIFRKVEQKGNSFSYTRSNGLVQKVKKVSGGFAIPSEAA